MSNKEINVLFGFDNQKVEEYICSELGKNGIKVNYQVKSTKNTISSFVQSHPDYNNIVLLEVMNKSRDVRLARWEADEIAALTDDQDMNVIVVLDESKKEQLHKGTEYMQVLYAANIMNAIYNDGKKNNNCLGEMVNLLKKTRTRKEAREYYGISEYVEIDFLSSSEFCTLCRRLYDPKLGESTAERFEKLCSKLNNEQIADFIRRMPLEVKKELEQTDTYQHIYEFVSHEIIPCETTGIITTESSIEKKKTRIKKHKKRAKETDIKKNPALTLSEKTMGFKKAKTKGEKIDGQETAEDSINEVQKIEKQNNTQKKLALFQPKSNKEPDINIESYFGDETENEDEGMHMTRALANQAEPKPAEANNNAYTLQKADKNEKKSSIIFTIFKTLGIILIIIDVILGLYLSNAFGFILTLIR